MIIGAQFSNCQKKLDAREFLYLSHSGKRNKSCEAPNENYLHRLYIPRCQNVLCSMDDGAVSRKPDKIGGANKGTVGDTLTKLRVYSFGCLQLVIIL